MARPTRKDIDSGLEDWDAEMDDNFAALFDTPLPPALYATTGVLPAAALYDGCIAWVSANNMLYISRNGSWKPLCEIVVFSTSEADSGLRWTGGQTIYKKTISLGSMPNSTTKNVAHSISGLAMVIKIEGMIDNGTLQYPLPAVTVNSGTFSEGVEVAISDTNIILDTTQDWSAYTGYLTIY
jgi:hypothetical protein